MLNSVITFNNSKQHFVCYMINPVISITETGELKKLNGIW